MISVSQGMVLVSALSAGGSSASASPQSPAYSPPDRHQCHGSAEADRGWGPRRGGTFYLFHLSQHLQRRGALATAATSILQRRCLPAASSQLLAARAGTREPSPSLLGPGRLGRMNSGPGYLATLPHGISAAPLETAGQCHHPAGGMLLRCTGLTTGRNRPFLQPSTTEAIKHLRSALLDELLWVCLS